MARAGIDSRQPKTAPGSSNRDDLPSTKPEQRERNFTDKLRENAQEKKRTIFGFTLRNKQKRDSKQPEADPVIAPDLAIPQSPQDVKKDARDAHQEHLQTLTEEFNTKQKQFHTAFQNIEEQSKASLQTMETKINQSIEDELYVDESIKGDIELELGIVKIPRFTREMADTFQKALETENMLHIELLEDSFPKEVKAYYEERKEQVKFLKEKRKISREYRKFLLEKGKECYKAFSNLADLYCETPDSNQPAKKTYEDLLTDYVTIKNKFENVLFRETKINIEGHNQQISNAHEKLKQLARTLKDMDSLFFLKGQRKAYKGPSDRKCIKQKDIKSCLVTCTEMIRSDHDKNHDYGDEALKKFQLLKLKDEDGIIKTGYSLDKAPEVLEHLKHPIPYTFTRTMSIEDIEEILRSGEPIIACIERKNIDASHAIVIDSMTDNDLNVRDPNFTEGYSVSIDDFIELWSGQVVVPNHVATTHTN